MLWGKKYLVTSSPKVVNHVHILFYGPMYICDPPPRMSPVVTPGWFSCFNVFGIFTSRAKKWHFNQLYSMSRSEVMVFQSSSWTCISMVYFRLYCPIAQNQVCRQPGSFVVEGHIFPPVCVGNIKFNNKIIMANFACEGNCDILLFWMGVGSKA